MRIVQNPCSRHLLHALAGLLCLSGAAFAQSSSPPGADPVRQVDHILILTNDPEPVFRLFSETLALPIAWPYQSYGAFASGGVSFGNVNLEIVKMATPDTARSAENQAQRADKGLAAFALKPSSVAEIVAWLDARGLKHAMPAPFHQKDPSGKEQLLWTVIRTSLPPAQCAFFCKYTFDRSAERARLAQVLAHRDGGPLGIRSAAELVLGVRDLAGAQRDWQSLLGRPASGARWELGSGPAIRLIAAQEDRLTTLRIKVKSLVAARAFLRSQNLLGLDTPREIALRPSAVGSADIRLVE